MNLKIKFKNTGPEAWPENTRLYLVTRPFLNIFLDDEDSFYVGSCKPKNGLKMVDFHIKAPSNAGTVKLDFRLGISQKGPYLGPIVTYVLNVEWNNNSVEEEGDTEMDFFTMLEMSMKDG